MWAYDTVNLKVRRWLYKTLEPLDKGDFRWELLVPWTNKTLTSTDKFVVCSTFIGLSFALQTQLDPGASVGVLALTFDVGRVVIAPADVGLDVSAAGDREALPAGLGSLDEEEPWWRLLGQPITAAWPGGVEEGVGASGLGSLMVLKLRFREESENPRVVRLERRQGYWGGYVTTMVHPSLGDIGH